MTARFVQVDSQVLSVWQSLTRRLQHLGYVTDPAGRFARYGELLQVPVERSFAWLSIREILEFDDIVATLAEDLAGGRDRRVRAVVAETGTDPSNLHGQDARLELLMHAAAKRGSGFPRVAEPDLVIRVPVRGRRRSFVGLACKRVKSIKKIAQRIVEAGEQIDKSPVSHGMIVLDVSATKECAEIAPAMSCVMDAVSADMCAYIAANHMAKCIDIGLHSIKQRSGAYPWSNRVTGILLRTSGLYRIGNAKRSVLCIRDFTLAMPLHAQTVQDEAVFAGTRDLLSFGLPESVNLDAPAKRPS